MENWKNNGEWGRGGGGVHRGRHAGRPGPPSPRQGGVLALRAAWGGAGNGGGGRPGG